MSLVLLRLSQKLRRRYSRRRRKVGRVSNVNRARSLARWKIRFREGKSFSELVADRRFGSRQMARETIPERKVFPCVRARSLFYIWRKETAEKTAERSDFLRPHLID